ncbi:MAG: hypothetical protein ACYSTO_12455 [Planctomycetota bacterium]|jgi:hypothetical protein
MNSLDTSVEAEPAEQRRDILRQYIYDILLGAGPEGMISDEVREQMAARYNVHSYSSSTARYKEMYDRGMIDYVGKRKGRSRRNQRIMVANKEWKDVHENME